MELNLYTHAGELPEAVAKGQHVVVVDVLRASSTIVHACENGVERIIPVAEVEDATRLIPTLDRKKTLLGGEREGVKIEGFDLGNSPLEYASKVVKGKTLIFSTSNGTVAMAQSAPAKEVLVGCFLNLGAMATHLVSSRAKKVAILCAGNMGHLSLEDFVCGGYLVDRIVTGSRARTDLNDGAMAASNLARCFKDIGEMVRSSAHGRRLAELGFAQDLDFCSKIDKYGTVPIVVDGRISLKNGARR
ncbi:MAG: 2-phosphosulfolactate phosphatase [Candidatus Eisenbacteria bacterium]|nr:2-phosphosulfolactate phosphatase [Candidatus Eisenbacteria bacterium]